MVFQRGDVVLLPFPYTDLSAAKTRPAIVVSSKVYHTVRTEILLAYVSSQIAKAAQPIDYILNDWKQAGLPKPSFVRPKIAAIDPTLIVHHVGQLSAQDLSQVDRRLRLAMALTESALNDFVNEIEFLKQSPTLVQAIAEKSVAALVGFVTSGNLTVNLNQIRKLV